MKQKILTVLMPALNEEQGIVDTIRSIPISKIKKIGYKVEVLIIDGKSTDKTRKLAEKAGARVITTERGYGKQYKIGLKEAKGEIIITGDADGTYPFENIPLYLNYFNSHNLDFITVNRFANLSKDSMHFSNKIGNAGLTFFTNLLFGFKIKDSQSGMWIIKKSILPKLKVTSDGMPFSQEIKIEAFTKVKSEEIPGFYKKRLGKTKLSKIFDGFGNLKFLFQKRLSN